MPAGPSTAAFLAFMLAGGAVAMPPPVDITPAPRGQLLLAGGCHVSVRRHYVPEFRQTVPHRHRQRDCDPVATGAPETAKPVDCHRDARRHYVPGAGMLYHRHVGGNCRIREIRRSGEPLPND